MSNIELYINLCHNLYMFIIECLPFSKGLKRESLSYFGPNFVEPGSLLKVNIRGKSTSALVLKSRDAREEKTEIKSASFQLKKISAVSAKPFLQKEFLEAARISAEYFSASLGNILAHLIPSFISENSPMLSALPKGILWNRGSARMPLDSFGSAKSEIAILQAPDEERFIHYRSLIREEFAKKRSVFLCLPQNEDIRLAKEKLERGIEIFVCAFHKDLSKKELKKEWKKACLTSHPVLIIGTAKWLFLPRDDFGIVIIDQENKNGWKTLARPFMDLRFFAETLARQKNIRLIIGDAFLRTETLYRYKQGEIAEFESVKWRLSPEIKVSIVDMKSIKKATPTGRQEKEFKTLSEDMLELIEKTTERGSHMFIFAARKGLSPVTICRDCGEQVKCSNCSSPMILYKTAKSNVFKCHQCEETRDAAEVCQNCRSWKLAAFGAGIDKVAEEIRREIPKANLFEIHKDIARTSAKALDIVKNFYDNKGSILLGTEIAFSYLHKKVANSAIASFDSLFSIPDFRIREKIFGLILQTRDLAKENFIIQSRNPNDSTVAFAVAGNLTEFYKKEIEDRQALGYPPFGIFIKITVRGGRSFTAKEAENLKNILKNFNPAVFNSVHEKKGEPSAVNAVIKFPKSEWPDSSLLSILKSLPPHFEIKVDPDNLL